MKDEEDGEKKIGKEKKKYQPVSVGRGSRKKKVE